MFSFYLSNNSHRLLMSSVQSDVLVAKNNEQDYKELRKYSATLMRVVDMLTCVERCVNNSNDVSFASSR